ncbi:potassium channel, beta subunit (oxidoreductase) [Oscillochloris trichoides DG-6]|uniref:Potassium channel, beta subunit (Oxidoreductase) n=1 Tax=Oscillochloris trichoides DG-6 TaxID=765420 RepID=E1ICG3_9CHLR|nr:aldo/keto reductase family protein [Oscillochloris trichoides]EFO81124.1 potassium channel, beta subunit (oxidoreductase) [Oscillochloris trichoides DG-6]
MRYRRLGDAGMKVSAVSLGGWINFGEGKTPAAAAREVVVRAYERGVNFFDLADIYGRGEAERQMGAILREFPRHRLVISSKVFWPMSDDVNDRGLSRKHIFESIDKSLARLGTEYLDIYFCHRADPETPLEETLRAMDDLVRMGKVLYWGTSEWEASQIAEAYALCERAGWAKPKVEQPQYSMLYRERVEKQILPITQPRGIGLVVWSPLAQGMLSGKYDDGIPADSRFQREAWARERYLNEQNAARVRALKPIADDLGITRSQLALAWALRNNGVSSVIVGATRAEQVEDNVAAAEVDLGADVLEAIEAILA